MNTSLNTCIIIKLSSLRLKFSGSIKYTFILQLLPNTNSIHASNHPVSVIPDGVILQKSVFLCFTPGRHIKLEAELAEMNWRVRWEDILFGSPEKSKRLERQGSRLSLNRVTHFLITCFTCEGAMMMLFCVSVYLFA